MGASLSSNRVWLLLLLGPVSVVVVAWAPARL